MKQMKTCAERPLLNLEVPKEGLTVELMLQPQEQVDKEAQYWPLFNAGNDSEEEYFGNWNINIQSGGVLTLKVTLDLSKVPGRNLEFVRYRQNHKLDGLIALTPDFRHQFRARAKEVEGEYTTLIIKIKDKEEIPDNFAFLWMCVDADTGMHFVSGDPEAAINPVPM
ncbi:hypothetical protein [Microbulbifer sp. JMSA003]|uniref:hypothetical protein n=1 Tax=Microbulbifer sp. JMSA003 TaxID=3243369 RepID=UPI0040393211